MEQRSTVFLQAVTVIIGIVTLAFMIRFPLTEGRAENLDLFSIYFNPFILYGYVASIAFFVVLYKAFKLLGYIGQNKAFSLNSVRALRSIKYCAVILSILIVLAGLYIMIFHNKEDDPAGFLAICIAATFISIAVAATAVMFGRILQKGMDLKSENEQLRSGERNNLNL
jgi:cytochrome bd-type quinol oxidase subunit 2